MVAGCGIPQITFLAPPQLGSVNILPPAVTFTHDPRNDFEGFRGYEIYYKFYPSVNAQTQFTNDLSSIDVAGPQTVTSVLDQRGFYRIFASGRDTLPAIEISASERGLAFDVSIQFQFTTTGEPAKATWSATGPEAEELVRDQSIFEATEGEIGFPAPDLIPGAHPDLPDDSELDPPAVDMAIVILSYGNDFETFSSVYSQPAVVDELLEIVYQ